MINSIENNQKKRKRNWLPKKLFPKLKSLCATYNNNNNKNYNEQEYSEYFDITN